MLTELESQVLHELLRGEVEELKILQHQLKLSKVQSRRMTGVGFFTDFSVPPEAPRLPDLQSFELGDVDGYASNVKHGVGFLLFVRAGQLNMLEGYTYDEPWPDEVNNLSLHYRDGVRNIEALRTIIKGRKK
jgi:hypothetical protein